MATTMQPYLFAGTNMQPYVARTGTRTQLDVFRAFRWRLMVSARGVLSDQGMGYALDNGAWTAHQLHEPFDVTAYERALQWSSGREDWVVLPDKVGDAAATLDMAQQWIGRLKSRQLYFALQDGVTEKQLEPLTQHLTGLFVGGSDRFKRTAARWVRFAHRRGLKVHVGRVNTRRRLEMCVLAGVDSFDGSGASRFLVHAEKVQRWLEELGVRW